MDNDLGRLSFDMMSPNFRHFGSKKTHTEERRHEAMQRLELFDFARFGTYISRGKWQWEETKSSITEGKVLVKLRLQNGQDCSYTFRVTWQNNQPIIQLKKCDNA